MELLKRLVVILFPELIALCILATYYWIDFQSTVILLIFNVLFLSLFYQLNGDSYIKLGLLAAGNGLGMTWNFCFHLVMLQAAESQVLSGATLSTFYTIAYPFLNSLWVISFWSLSLNALHPRKTFTGKLPI